VRSEVRHQLKQDRFAAATKESLTWAVEHRINLIGGFVVAAVIISGSLGYWYYTQQRQAKASEALGKALQTLQAQVIPNYHDPNTTSFGTIKERAQAAIPQLEAVVSQFPRTQAAEHASYLEGLAKMDAGDNTGAEQSLKRAADTRNLDLQSLAKMALASLARHTGRDSEAIAIYKDLEAHPTRSVSKEMAELQLAALYAAKQPQEALKIYKQMSVEGAGGPAAQMAQSKMAELKP